MENENRVSVIKKKDCFRDELTVEEQHGK